MRNADGSVLPGFLRTYGQSQSTWHESEYNNVTIKTGTVVAAYSPSDEKNASGVVWEYDVEVFAADGTQLATPVTYKNCHMQSGFGGTADKFLWVPRLRGEIETGPDGKPVQAPKHPGSKVLIQCIRGITHYAVIIGAIQPASAFVDPLPTTEPENFSDGPTLLWEYNGVHVDVMPDGSVTITRKGPTNDDGSLVNTNDEQAGANIVMDADGNITAQTGDGKNSIVIDGKDGKITATADQEMDLVSTNGTMNLTSQGAIKIKSSTDAVTITGQQGVTITDGIGKITLANGTIQLKGAADELIALVASLVQLLLTATATTPMGPAPLDPGTLAQLPQIYAKLLVLSGG